MSSRRYFKTFILLGAFFGLSAFAANPANLDLPASLQAAYATIDAMDDCELLCSIMPEHQEDVEQTLVEKMIRIKEYCTDPVTKKLAHSYATWKRISSKALALDKELKASNYAHVFQKQLEDEFHSLRAQSKEWEKYVCSQFNGNKVPLKIYFFEVSMAEIYYNQAFILRTKNEKLEQEKSDLQQREESLRAQLRGYKLLEDRQQVEGELDEPGGVKPKLKRRGSF